MKRCLILFLLIFLSCSTATVYNVDLDLLSFVDIVDLEQDLIFPASMDLELYLFPEVEISTGGPGGPGTANQEGVLISIPREGFDIQDIQTLSVKLEIETVITNKSESDAITGDRISLYIDTADSKNIYADGIRIDLLNIETILPLDNSTLEQVFYLEEDSSIMEILRTGEFRLGLGIFLTSSAEFVTAEYKLNKINLSTKFTPVDLILFSDEIQNL